MIMKTQKSELVAIKKPGKARKFFRRAWTGVKIFTAALLVSGIIKTSTAYAQTSDTSKVKGDGENGLVLKPHLTLKAFGRMYDGGKKEGVGLGINYGVDIDKVSIGGSVSFAKVMKTGKIEVEEGGLWAYVPVGKFGIVPYVYQDQYFNVYASTYGVNVSGFGVKVGGEIAPYKDADGFWDVYVKVPLGSFIKVPLGSFTPTVAIAGWGDNGWQGGPKKFVFHINASHEIAKNVTVTGETFYGIKLEGGEGNLNFRVTLNCIPF